MTDLERARTLGGEKIIEGLKDALAHALVQRVLHIWCEEMAVERIAEALAAARQEGAEAAQMQSDVLVELGRRQGAAEMRERAAQIADDGAELLTDSDIQFVSASTCASDLAKDIADAIRALPLTPEEP